MSTSAVSHRRVLFLVPLLLVALLAWWATRSDSEAAASVTSKAASTSQAGRIAFDSLPGAVKATLPVRSFSVGGANSSTPGGGGGGAGKFTADDPVAVIDATDVDPLLLRAVTTGVHLQKVTVSLFRPGTTTQQESWEFADVTITALHTAQSGSAKSPRVSLGLRYAQVTLTTYDAKGAVERSFCFALDMNAVC
jgi:type VI protein secretion system component Hcp